jgi:hypothetical protein
MVVIYRYSMSWRKLILIVLAWATVVTSVAVFADLTLTAAPSSAYTGDAAFSGGARFVTGLVRFDALHYLVIAEHGYTRSDPGLEAFFPLYPLTVHLVAAPLEMLHHSQMIYPLVAIGLNLLLIMLGLSLLMYLLKLDLKPAYALIGALLLLVTPFSFFLLAPYTEALFLCLTVGSFLAARRQVWWLAGLLAALASATRFPGLLLVPVLAIEYLDQVGWRIEKVKTDLLWLLLAPLGAVAYFGYLAMNGGITGYLSAYHTSWPERKFDLNIISTISRPIESMAHSGHISLNALMALGALAGVLTLLVITWRELRPSYRVYTILSLILPLLTTTLDSVGRYYMLIFPVYLMLAIVARRRPFLIGTLAFAGAAYGSLMLMLFVKGYFIG